MWCAVNKISATCYTVAGELLALVPAKNTTASKHLTTQIHHGRIADVLC